MKRLSIIIISMFAVINMITAKEIHKLNDFWRFRAGRDFGTTTEPVALPHVWKSQTINSGRYFRELSLPATLKNKTIYLKFNGVAAAANLFINNRFVGEHKGSHTAVTFDITPFVSLGTTNQIMLEVSSEPNYAQMPLQNDYFAYGGIYRDVELIIVDSEHLSQSTFGDDGVIVRQNNISKQLAEFDVVIEVSAMAGDTVSVNTLIMDDSDIVARKSEKSYITFDGSSEIVMPFKIEDPRLWNGKIDPFRYTVVVTVMNSNGEISDRAELRIGLRSAMIDPKRGFLLNGEPYPIRGVVVREDKFGAGNGYTKHDTKQEMNAILDLGATAVRTSPGPMSQYFYELCDQYGIIVWCDFPFVGDGSLSNSGFVNSYLFTSNGERQMSEMLNQYNNHPSIIFYGIFNKISSKGDNPLPFIDKLNRMAQDFSPDRITVATSIEDGKLNYITDAIGWGQYFGWKSGYMDDFDVWVKGFNNQWGELLPVVSDYGAEGRIDHGYSHITPKEGSVLMPEEYQSDLHTSYIRTLNSHNRFWGYFINSLTDYRTSATTIEGDSKYAYYGLISYDRSTKKDAYFLYKANWNKDEKFVHLSNRRKAFNTGNKNIIKIFSNCELAELKVNGINYGVKKIADGYAQWENIPLLEGDNSIEVVADMQYTDNIIIETVSVTKF